MAERFVLHTHTDVKIFLTLKKTKTQKLLTKRENVGFGVSRDGERESKT